MATLDSMFVQIFERKKRIIEQVKHQSLLFDHYLASKCLLDGISPPPWLWPSSLSVASSNQTELKKDDGVISRIPQHSQTGNPDSSSHCSLPRNTVVASEDANVPNRSPIRTCDFSESFDVDDRLSTIPQTRSCDPQCPFDGIAELDCSVTSPQDHKDVTTCSNGLVSAMSSLRIQRSKSRQRALEIRNNATVQTPTLFSSCDQEQVECFHHEAKNNPNDECDFLSHKADVEEVHTDLTTIQNQTGITTTPDLIARVSPDHVPGKTEVDNLTSPAFVLGSLDAARKNQNCSQPIDSSVSGSAEVMIIPDKVMWETSSCMAEATHLPNCSASSPHSQPMNAISDNRKISEGGGSELASTSRGHVTPTDLASTNGHDERVMLEKKSPLLDHRVCFSSPSHLLVDAACDGSIGLGSELREHKEIADHSSLETVPDKSQSQIVDASDGKMSSRRNSSLGGGRGNCSDCLNGENMGEFEGFTSRESGELACDAEGRFGLEKLELPNNDLERISMLERLCKSAACLRSPLTQFSTEYKCKELNLYRSIPNGLLEGMGWRNNRTNPNLVPILRNQSAWDIKKPCLSPVMAYKSGSSGKRTSSVPELPCISEENENVDEMVDAYQRCAAGSGRKISSVAGETVIDATEKLSFAASVCVGEFDRGSQASIRTKISAGSACKKVKLEGEIGHHGKRRSTVREKEKSGMLYESGVKKDGELVHKKLSRKPSMRKGVPLMSQKLERSKNLVTNLSSLLPLLKKKQVSDISKGKRGIKVKALEAAEAAKRLAEKKENERRRRKEALRLERTKAGEKHSRQFELQVEKKAEGRIKKGVDVATKKRQREDEEERKEKEWKNKCVDEEVHVDEENEKNTKNQPEIGKAYERENSHNECEKHVMVQTIRGEDNHPNVSSPMVDSLSAYIGTEDSNLLIDSCDNSKAVGCIYNTMDGHSFSNFLSREESYEISPFKDSDEEEDDNDFDVKLSTKPIPSWARSENSLAMIVAAQQRIDPELVFCPQGFCRIVDVLLPQKLQKQ